MINKTRRSIMTNITTRNKAMWGGEFYSEGFYRLVVGKGLSEPMFYENRPRSTERASHA